MDGSALMFATVAQITSYATLLKVVSVGMDLKVSTQEDPRLVKSYPPDIRIILCSIVIKL